MIVPVFAFVALFFGFCCVWLHASVVRAEERVIDIADRLATLRTERDHLRLLVTPLRDRVMALETENALLSANEHRSQARIAVLDEEATDLRAEVDARETPFPLVPLSLRPPL